MSNTYNFGAGNLWAVRTDVANAPPVKFGALQDVSVEFSASSKPLFGQNQFPLAVARGSAKIQCKAKFAKIDAKAFGSLFFGSTPATGQTTEAVQEAGTVPASSTYTVTVANHTTWTADLGVFYAASGIQLTQVASGSEATGKYSVAAGVYTFAAGDASAALKLDYQYTTTGGLSWTQANPLLGQQPVFQAVLSTSWNGPNGNTQADLTLLACIASKLTFATKLEDWVVPEMDFDAFANNAGNVFTWSFNQAA